MIKEVYGSQGGSAKSRKLLKPVVDGWHKAMRHYAEIHKGDDDAGYFYNERANISFLAAGAWLSGGGALEEYVSSKYRSRKKSSGRVDHRLGILVRSPSRLTQLLVPVVNPIGLTTEAESRNPSVL
jgi:hypothetical protein